MSIPLPPASDLISYLISLGVTLSEQDQAKIKQAEIDAKAAFDAEEKRSETLDAPQDAPPAVA